MKMSSAKQIFDSLPGIWKLTRETLTPLKQWQYSGAECIRANGFAAFIPSESDPNLLIYSEKVTIINSGNDNSNGMNGMEAKQKYKYRYDTTTSALTKYFFDDRLFYTLKIEEQHDNETTEATASNQVIECGGTHLCIQDLYEANYSFGNGNYFELKYTINGPKKCYEINNKYEKCNSNEAADLGLHIENGEIL